MGQAASTPPSLGKYRAMVVVEESPLMVTDVLATFTTWISSMLSWPVTRAFTFRILRLVFTPLT